MSWRVGVGGKWDRDGSVEEDEKDKEIRKAFILQARLDGTRDGQIPRADAMRQLGYASHLHHNFYGILRLFLLFFFLAIVLDYCRVLVTRRTEVKLKAWRLL